MATKADFTPEEWKAIANAPLSATLAISIADPSNPVGLIQESFAAGQSVLEAAKGADALGVIKSIAEDLQARSVKPELPHFENAEAAKSYVFGQLRQATAAVDAKAPAEAAGYRQWLYDTAKRAAAAAKEGGFLGIGGVAVSEQEQAALSELAELLGVAA
jgi:hypothetical protein